VQCGGAPTVDPTKGWTTKWDAGSATDQAAGAWRKVNGRGDVVFIPQCGGRGGRGGCGSGRWGRPPSGGREKVSMSTEDGRARANSRSLARRSLCAPSLLLDGGEECVGMCGGLTWTIQGRGGDHRDRGGGEQERAGQGTQANYDPGGMGDRARDGGWAPNSGSASWELGSAKEPGARAEPRQGQGRKPGVTPTLPQPWLWPGRSWRRNQIRNQAGKRGSRVAGQSQRVRMGW
jgi:hypothetical protein